MGICPLELFCLGVGMVFSTVSFVNMYLSDCITFAVGGNFWGHVLKNPRLFGSSP